jgi:hypothetical protein
MMLLSSFFNKTNGVLSLMNPSGSRSSARRGSADRNAVPDLTRLSSAPEKSCPVSSLAAAACSPVRRTASTGNDTDISYANTMSNDCSISSNSGATPLNKWLSLNPISDSSTVSNSNTRENWSLGATSPDPYGSVQELAASARSRDPPSRYRALEVALGLFDNPPSERYKAVEGMLHFLDVQAENRVSASSR